MFRDLLTPVSIMVLAAVVLFDRMGPQFVPSPVAVTSRVPAVNGLVLGKAYAPVLLSTYGDAWLAAAKALEEGKPVAEARKTLQETWNVNRGKAFTEHVASSFALVLPEGAEPSTPEKRTQVANLWRDFALGLKGGK